jgi:cytidylate kinase
MKAHYDFSGGVRGRFYRKGAKLRVPIYLDARLQSRLERIARKHGKDIGELVNTLLKKEIHSA